ncbi:MAG: hypothetical protein ACFFDK_17370 [Promethearchaeota archaeon]
MLENEYLDRFLEIIQDKLDSVGLSLNYPHRPITPSLAEALLLGSIIGSRVAPHLTWILGDLELTPTIIGPHIPGNVPSSFIDPFSIIPSIDRDPWLDADIPSETDRVNMENLATPMMGGAIALTVFFINNIDTIPNFNLDSDRGYGYKTWEHRGEPILNPFKKSDQIPVNLSYL